jgi:hypothetical protein
MAAGRAPMWFVLAVPGVVLIAIGLANVLPAGVATQPGAIPREQPAADVAPPAVAAPTEDAIGFGCVAPPCDDQVSRATFSYWRSGETLHEAAITGRVVDANGKAVAPRTLLRFWTAARSWCTWTKDDGTFVLDVTARNADYDVDVVFPGSEFPRRRDGRFHVGAVHTGERDVVLAVPVAR